jgi:hypothetical protein
VAGLGLRWGRDRWGLRRLRGATERGDYEAAVAASPRRLMRLRKQGDSVRTQRAVALLVLGRPGEAADALAGWRRGPPATREFLWACVHAALGQASIAKARIASCLAHDPDLGRQLLGDPLLSSLLQKSSPSQPPTASPEGYI